MKALTWTRESHGLFDYESSNVRKRELKADSSFDLMRIGDNVELKNLDQQDNSDAQADMGEIEHSLLFSIVAENNGSKPIYSFRKFQNSTEYGCRACQRPTMAGCVIAPTRRLQD